MTDAALAARLLGIFVEELEEQLRELNHELLALERTPDDAARLGAVFRVMHTLKGASRAVGLKQVEEVCHALEHELGNARDRHVPLSGGQLALLFEAADALADLVEPLRRAETGARDGLTLLLRHIGDRRQEPQHPAATVARNESPSRRDDRPRDDDPPRERREAEPPAADAADALRERNVRVSVSHVDSIAGISGEIGGLETVLQERTDVLATLRSRLRLAHAGTVETDESRAIHRELTSLIRCLRDDSRTFANVASRLSSAAQRLRQRPLSELTEATSRVVRDVARDLGKQARVMVVGGEIEADRVVLESLRDPLLHLVRNAVDHGIELPAQRAAAKKDPEGEVRITGVLRGDRLRLAVSDDGPGLDLAAVAARLRKAGRPVPADADLLMRTILDDGFTTRDVLTTVSGRGVGLGIVRTAAERMGGSVEITSERGVGTTITLDVPLSVATMRVLLVRVSGVILGIPSAAITRVLRIEARNLVRMDDRTVLPINGVPASVRSLASLLGPPFQQAAPAERMQAAVVESAGRRLALIVDDLLDERELVLRPVELAESDTNTWSVGSSVLGSGEVALVLNPAALIAEDVRDARNTSLVPDAESRVKARILVVDDSITSRTLEESVLSAAGYNVRTAVDGEAAWSVIEREDFALVVSDVEMPYLDGFSLCARIRANPRTAQIPVVLVTSLDDDEQRAKGMNAGADAYITKSGFDQDILLETVRMLIGESRGGAK